MTYESAPGTKMLATRCICCGRPLLDAVSVEVGIGPVCRKKSGYEDVFYSENRSIANVLVRRLAQDQSNFSLLYTTYLQLQKLGFERLADTIGSRLADIKIVEKDQKLYVTSPYNPTFVEATCFIPGRKWDKKKRHTEFNANTKGALYCALKKAYPGYIGFGAKGPFKL
jgi:hypothetical protein